MEPEWEGYVTLEFSNTTPLPAKIYANEGVAQVIFLEAAADDVCETSYRDRGGKYQGQSGRHAAEDLARSARRGRAPLDSTARALQARPPEPYAELARSGCSAPQPQAPCQVSSAVRRHRIFPLIPRPLDL